MGYIGQITIASILSQEARFNPFNNGNKTKQTNKKPALYLPFSVGHIRLKT